VHDEAAPYNLILAQIVSPRAVYLFNDTSKRPCPTCRYHDGMLPVLIPLATIAVSLYDLRRGKVPNYFSLPLLVAGLAAHFPGTLDVWLICLLLYAAWQTGGMAAGDAKLWMAVLWILPPQASGTMPAVFFATFLTTGLLQILFRLVRSQALTGLRTPGAWRTIPFTIWSLYVH
jgi:Flp pilus assembly protein protease CpaA